MSEIKQHWQKIELNEILSISSKKFNPISNNEKRFRTTTPSNI